MNRHLAFSFCSIDKSAKLNYCFVEMNKGDRFTIKLLKWEKHIMKLLIKSARPAQFSTFCVPDYYQEKNKLEWRVQIKRRQNV